MAGSNLTAEKRTQPERRSHIHYVTMDQEVFKDLLFKYISPARRLEQWRVYNEISLQFPSSSRDFMTIRKVGKWCAQHLFIIKGGKNISYWTTDNIYKGLESFQNSTHITTGISAKAWPASELAFQMCYRPVYYLPVRVWKWPVFLSVRAEFQTLNDPEFWQRWHSISEHGCLTQVGKISFYGFPVLFPYVDGSSFSPLA